MKSRLFKMYQIMFLFAAVCFSFQCSAMDLKQQGRKVFLSGLIQSGDATKFTLYFMNYSPEYVSSLQLILDSPGGDVAEALKIASVIRVLHQTALVKGGGHCASSCFFLYLAADVHYGSGSDVPSSVISKIGLVGLHRPYFITTSSDSIQKQNDLIVTISNYLREQTVPQRLIDEMMSRPSNDIYWMTDKDIMQLGDYQPGYEEILIKECGYDRRDYINLSYDELMKKSSRIGTCSAEVSKKYFDDNLAKTISRLRMGWRPWNK